MIRLGVIGAGANAAGHVRYYASSPRCQIVAIADPDLPRAQELAAEAHAQPLADYHDFLDKVDAVIISSPNFLHKEQAVTCAQAKLHVYCEKPMGLSLSDAQEIAQAVKQAEVKSVVGFSVRFDPVMQTMQRLLHEAELGTLISLNSRRIAYFDPAQTVGWRRDPRLSGGYLLEISLHELDWMVAFGGKVQSVFARTWSAEPDIPRNNDHVWVTLNFVEGAVGTHEGGWLVATPIFYRAALGTRRSLHTDEWGNTLYSALNGQNREALALDSAFNLREHFLDCIEHDTKPVADARYGLDVMAVAEAIQESAQSGQVIPVQQITL